MAVYGNVDQPIQNKSEDSFGVENYVDGLCKFVTHCATPMTISIQGDWGSGKTSMMNMIKEIIKKDVHTIWFNTWQYSQFNMQDELTISMLCSLLKELKVDEEQRKKYWDWGVKALKLVAYKGTEKLTADMVDSNTVEQLFENGGMDVAEQIKSLKEDVQKAVDNVLKKTGKKRVVIFVDDLDRLQPAKAVEILEVLKVFLDCNNCVYILAVDYEVVAQGIKQKFGDMVGEQKGKSFFDKIIQLPFKMPVAQYNIENYVEGSLKNMGIEIPNTEIPDYVELIKKSIGCNPRSMKRLFNTYHLLDIIMQSKGCVAGNGRKLLFAIICMQMEYEGLYRYIANNCDDLSEEKLLKLSGATNVVENEIEYNELKETLEVTDDSDLARIFDFMKLFNRVLQLDAEEAISLDELNNLKKVMFFASVTSVAASGDVAPDRGKLTDYRRHNYYNIAIPLNKIINVKCKALFKALRIKYEMGTFQCNWGNPYHNYSDLFGILNGETATGIHYTFGYSLKINTVNTVITLELFVCLRGNVCYPNIAKYNDGFWKFFNEAPIKRNVCITNKNLNAYIWENVRKFSIDDDPPVDEMVEIINEALIDFKDFVHRRELELDG